MRRLFLWCLAIALLMSCSNVEPESLHLQQTAVALQWHQDINQQHSIWQQRTIIALLEPTKTPSWCGGVNQVPCDTSSDLDSSGATNTNETVNLQSTSIALQQTSIAQNEIIISYLKVDGRKVIEQTAVAQNEITIAQNDTLRQNTSANAAYAATMVVQNETILRDGRERIQLQQTAVAQNNEILQELRNNGNRQTPVVIVLASPTRCPYLRCN
jgi:hypothetical protein